MGKVLSVNHKLSTHKRTEYDESRRLLTAFFKDGSIYQFLDVPKRIFSDIETVETSKGSYKDLEDNDVVSDYYFGHLWESIVLRHRGTNRWFDKKMRFYYVKIKAPANSKHGTESYK